MPVSPLKWGWGLALLLAAPANAQTWQVIVERIVDGDTIVICRDNCEFRRHVRLYQIDTPEPWPDKAKCAQEITLGRQASAYLKTLLPRGTSVVIVIRGRPSYGRDVGDVMMNGLNVGQHMVSMGYAMPWLKGRPKPNWCGNQKGE